MSASTDEGDEDEILSDNLSSSSSDNEPEAAPPRPLSQAYFAPPSTVDHRHRSLPSPSLTSLLRPSRPTTPDASDDDNNNLAPVPHAAPRVPTYEYYGFVLYLFSSLTFLTYLLWAYLPSPSSTLGIYYYPNRWWALAIPSFIVMTLCYIYVALAGYNVEILTVEMSSVETIVDGAGCVAEVADEKGKYGRRVRRERREGEVRWREIWNEGTDAVLDVPLGGVCEVLYGERREEEEEN